MAGGVSSSVEYGAWRRSLQEQQTQKETHATPKQVARVDTIRVEIDEVFGSGRPIEGCLEELVRYPVRLVLQQVLEDEVSTWLGRRWSSRRDGGREGQRNGHRDLTIKTTAGPVESKRPTLRNTVEKFASTLLGKRRRQVGSVGSVGDLGLGARSI